MALKYIRGRIGFVIFSESMTHSEVARRLSLELGEIKGAGFVHVADNPEEIKTYGKSVSLKMDSRE